MKLLYTFIITLVFFVQACNSKEQKDSYKSRLYYENSEYKKLLETFDSKYLCHFPIELDTLPMSYIQMQSTEFDNNVGIFLQMPIKNGGSIIDSVSVNAIANYSADDSCLLIVNRFKTQDNWLNYHISLSDKDKSKINQLCYSDKFPVPNFWKNEYLTEQTDCKLPSDFTIYVIEAKSGKFFNDDYITTGRHMPENWKNGFSRGVAISNQRNVVIYWFIAW